MAKNHHDRRDALFESSDYLADTLAQCAFIEAKLYREGRSSHLQDLKNPLVRLYKAILHYTALVQKAQTANKARSLLDCVSAITENPLTELKASVETERESLRRWIELGEYLHREEEAKNILDEIDELAGSMKQLTEQSGFKNLPIAEGAFFDSYVNQHEDFCLLDTRTDLLRQVLEWAQSEDKLTFWLNGMAGTGKSTIARTVAQSFQEQDLLGATFFFKRGEADRDNARRLISTIIRQLVTRYQQLVPAVLVAMKNDLNIASKSLGEQFNKLLYQPLMSLHPDQSTTTVIVIDALDECDGEDDIKAILKILFKLQEIQSIHLRVFLTSRPELPIRLKFRDNENHQDLILHELPKPVVEHDIRVFLKHKLSEIQFERSLSPDWPGNDNRERLVQMAVPLFIFAATACRFIREGTHPQKRLQKFLEFQATGKNQMDKIYLPILDRLIGDDEEDAKELVKEFQDVVGIIILLATPLSIGSLALLLEKSAHEVSELLDPLHSVLNIPSDRGAPVRILHLSFRDYLLVTESPFRIHKQETHGKIASHCLRLMNTQLKHNVCDLASYGAQREDIDPQMINQRLTAGLQYSCRYWVHHLKESNGHISESEILAFLKKRFLHWLGALALIGSISDAVEMINTLQSSTRVGFYYFDI